MHVDDEESMDIVTLLHLYKARFTAGMQSVTK